MQKNEKPYGTGNNQETRRQFVALLLLSLCLSTIGAAFLFLPAIPQNPLYHQFADRREFWGVNNFYNVVSNIPLVVVGGGGLALLLLRQGNCGSFAFPGERTAYLVFFAGIALTGIASAWYHLSPENYRLLGDRLAMTIGFVSLMAIVLAERYSLRWARRLLVPLLVAGAAAAGYWYVSEELGRGDLRAYALVQALSIFGVLFLVIFLPSRYSHGNYFALAVALYILAFLTGEVYDRAIFSLGQKVSGHTLKHILGALAVYPLIIMLRRRNLIRSQQF